MGAKNVGKNSRLSAWIQRVVRLLWTDAMISTEQITKAFAAKDLGGVARKDGEPRTIFSCLMKTPLIARVGRLLFWLVKSWWVKRWNILPEGKDQS